MTKTGGQQGAGDGDAERRDVLSAVSDGLVAEHKRFYGRGPTAVRTYFQDDLLVCILRGGFSHAEQSLSDAGRGAAVLHQRHENQGLMEARFVEVVQAATGRKVMAFMSGNHLAPDLGCEVFLLGEQLPGIARPGVSERTEG